MLKVLLFVTAIMGAAYAQVFCAPNPCLNGGTCAEGGSGGDCPFDTTLAESLSLVTPCDVDACEDINEQDVEVFVEQACCK